jgi:general secretion pathway protein M
MSALKARLDKLEPRERRLLTVLGVVFTSLIFLGVPLGLHNMVSNRRASNDELRAAVSAVYEGRAHMAEKRAKHDALLARYAKPAPALAGFLEQMAQANGLVAAESQDRPELPHGKRFVERMTVIKMHKIGMLPLSKMIEKIEQSGYPVSVSRLSIKPRGGEPDSYEVEMGVSAFDRKADPKADKEKADKDAPASSAAPEKDL